MNRHSVNQGVANPAQRRILPNSARRHSIKIVRNRECNEERSRDQPPVQHERSNTGDNHRDANQRDGRHRQLGKLSGRCAVPRESVRINPMLCVSEAHHLKP